MAAAWRVRSMPATGLRCSWYGLNTGVQRGRGAAARRNHFARWMHTQHSHQEVMLCKLSRRPGAGFMLPVQIPGTYLFIIINDLCSNSELSRVSRAKKGRLGWLQCAGRCFFRSQALWLMHTGRDFCRVLSDETQTWVIRAPGFVSSQKFQRVVTWVVTFQGSQCRCWRVSYAGASGGGVSNLWNSLDARPLSPLRV